MKMHTHWLLSRTSDPELQQGGEARGEKCSGLHLQLISLLGFLLSGVMLLDGSWLHLIFRVLVISSLIWESGTLQSKDGRPGTSH